MLSIHFAEFCPLSFWQPKAGTVMACQVEVPLPCQLPLSVDQGSSLLIVPLLCQLPPSGNLLEIFIALILTELI